MFLVRDIMFCKPGKVRAMVDKFKAVAGQSQKMGMRSMRIMTDVCGERYWTVVAEVEVASLDEFTAMSEKSMAIPELQDAMKGYHDLVEGGRREIYMIEA